MYVEWYGVCNLVVSSVVARCVDYGVVICVDVCFGSLGVACCVVDVWGVVIFVSSVMHVVGGVLLWVIYVFRRVDMMCWCLLRTPLQF